MWPNFNFIFTVTIGVYTEIKFSNFPLLSIRIITLMVAVFSLNHYKKSACTIPAPWNCIALSFYSYHWLHLLCQTYLQILMHMESQLVNINTMSMQHVFMRLSNTGVKQEFPLQDKSWKHHHKMDKYSNSRFWWHLV